LLFGWLNQEAKFFIEIWHFRAADKSTAKANVLGGTGYRSVRGYNRGWPGDINSRVSASFTRHRGAPFPRDGLKIENFLESQYILP
jgi:hypothetical protein